MAGSVGMRSVDCTVLRAGPSNATLRRMKRSFPAPSDAYASPAPRPARRRASFLAALLAARALLVRDARPRLRGHLHAPAISCALAGARRRRIAARRARGRALDARARPVPRGRLRVIAGAGWTLLVQGVNLHRRAADALLRRFAFVPLRAPRRPDGELRGARRRRRSAPRLLRRVPAAGRRTAPLALRARSATCRFVPGLPLKILRKFAPSARRGARARRHALPAAARRARRRRAGRHAPPTRSAFAPPAPRGARAGVPRSPARPRSSSPGRYADPGIAPRRGRRAHRRRDAAHARRDARARSRGIARFVDALPRARRSPSPRPTSCFDAPDAAALARRVRRRASRERGCALDRRTQWLYDDAAMYVNGEARDWPRRGRALPADARRRACADGRGSGQASPPAIVTLLHEDYRHGYLHPA